MSSNPRFVLFGLAYSVLIGLLIILLIVGVGWTFYRSMGLERQAYQDEATSENMRNQKKMHPGAFAEPQ